MLKKIIAVLLSILTLLPLAACGRKDPEKIFTKTVHDFEGQAIYQLTEAEDENFAVFSEGAREIISAEGENVLLLADEESLTYRFSNPGADMLALEEGDVAYGWFPEPIGFKVKSLEMQGSVLVVEGAELSMEEMYTYIDIDTEIAIENVQVTPADSSVQLETVELGSAENLSAADTPEISFLGKGTGASAQNAGTQHMGVKMSVNLGVSYGGVELSGSASAVIESITLTCKYDKASEYFFLEAGFTHGLDCDFTVTGKANLATYRKLLAGVKYPTMIPLMTGENNVCFVISATGKMEGGVALSGRHYHGGAISWDLSKGAKGADIINTGTDPSYTRNLKLVDISGEVKAGLEFEQGVGFMGAANVLMSFFGGIKITATEEDVYGEDTSKNPDSIHACDICLNLKFALCLDMSTIGRIGFAGSPLEIRGTFAGAELPNGKGYLSLKRGEDTEPEFGDGTCPHKLWRVDVTVIKEDGKSADGAEIKVSLPNGSEKSETGDNAGKATFYLPNGDNKLSASLKGERGSATALVKDEPQEVMIRLLEQRDVYIVCDSYYSDIYSQHNGPSRRIGIEQMQHLIEKIQAEYPDAVVVEEQRDVTQVFYGVPAYFYDDNGMTEGDIVVYISRSTATDDVAVAADESRPVSTATDGRYNPLVEEFYDITNFTITCGVLHSTLDREGKPALTIEMLVETWPKIYFETIVEEWILHEVAGELVGNVWPIDYETYKRDFERYGGDIYEKEAFGTVTRRYFYDNRDKYVRTLETVAMDNYILPAIAALQGDAAAQEWMDSLAPQLVDSSGDIVVSETP